MAKFQIALVNLDNQKPADVQVGLVGLGLMGTSIAACLLSADHSVVGIERDAARRTHARQRVRSLLSELRDEGLTEADPSTLVQRLRVSANYSDLAGSAVVVEAITESRAVKIKAFQKIENAVSPNALLATNTSAIPITELQRRLRHPGRFLGMHWSEPAHATVFMEIVQGEQTSPAYTQLATEWAERWWGKKPAIVRRDVRGFITNRISYAMFREACHLVEAGIASTADIDRSLRNDVGWWMSLTGPFRYMDLMGVQSYARVMRDLLPDLSCQKKVPELVRKATRSGGHGISTLRGFYRYTPAEARRWEEVFRQFSYDMLRLTRKYDELIKEPGSQPARSKRRRSRTSGRLR